MMLKMKANLFKNGKIIKHYSDIIRVDVDKKYGYFVLHQHIYHHTIIFTIRFTDCDKIVTTEKGQFDTKIERTYTPNENISIR